MLFVALDEQGTAMSDVPLYWDDGETIGELHRNSGKNFNAAVFR